MEAHTIDDEGLTPIELEPLAAGDGGFVGFCRSALIVGGAIAVWLALVAAIVAAVVLALAARGSSSPATFTDRQGNSCLRSETQAVPYLLCPQSITP